MIMLEKCEKVYTYFKEYIDKVMYLHTSVKVNKVEILKTLDNELVEKKRLGHTYFTILDNLRA